MENIVIKAVNGILSFKQWRDKHSVKLANVPLKEQRRRYDQYRMTFASDQEASLRGAYREMPPSGKGVLSLGSLSKCSRDYATALIDPWACKNPPCVPDLIVLPSYKFGARSRGTFTVGTQGVGYVAVNSYAVVQNSNPDAGDLVPAGWYTTQGFTGDSYKQYLGNDYQQLLFNDSSYAPAQLGPSSLQFQYRIVGCGVKARYTGSEMSRSGRMIAYRNTFNAPADFNTNGNKFLLTREAQISASDRNYHYVTFKPATPNDVAYRVGATQNPDLILYVDGCVPGTTFEFDCQWWFELVGNGLPSLTKSHSDPLGMAAVASALPMTQPQLTPGAELAKMLTNVQHTSMMDFSFIGSLLAKGVNAIGGVENILPIAEALFM